MESPFVFHIQRYSIHDGDGIRTTIFFKGCPLSCQWCHNPESQTYTSQLMFYHERCTGCGSCIKHCPNGANTIENHQLKLDRSKCTNCGLCTDYCFQNAREIVGKAYTVQELVKEAEKDQMFYEDSGGGITLSGGEVMVQNIDFLEELCRILHKKGYRVNIDTCGYAPFSHFQRLLPYVDLFLYDIKHMDPQAHQHWMGVDNRLILENLEKLSQAGANLNIRIPIIAGVNDTEEFINQVISYLRNACIRVKKVNLLPYHNTGKSKYENLNRSYPDEAMRVPDKEKLELFQQIFIHYGYTNIKIGG